jgi:hypothetical protein
MLLLDFVDRVSMARTLHPSRRCGYSKILRDNGIGEQSPARCANASDPVRVIGLDNPRKDESWAG